MPPVSKESPTSKSGELLHLAAAKAISYVDNIRERAVGTAQAALAALAGFHEPFPAEPCDPAQVLKQLDASVSLTAEWFLQRSLQAGWQRHGIKTPPFA